MIWSLFKKEVPVVSELAEIVFLDENQVKWRYKPVKHITALEVAKLLPVFGNLSSQLNIWKYIIDNNLTRHFERVE